MRYASCSYMFPDRYYSQFITATHYRTERRNKMSEIDRQLDTSGMRCPIPVLKAAKEFETSLLTAMLEQMWTGVEAEAPFGGGHAEKVYRSMVVGEYAKSISAAGGIGIADHVYREILSAQEGQS